MSNEQQLASQIDALTPLSERRPRRRFGGFVGTVVTMIFVILVMLQIYGLQKSVSESNILANPPVVISELVPDREIYNPGDTIRFTYTRSVKAVDAFPFPIVMLGRDLFENIDTEETFEAALVAKVVREAGDFNKTAVRRIPANCTPGEYSLTGFLAVQSDRMSKVRIYTSKPFWIVAPKAK